MGEVEIDAVPLHVRALFRVGEYLHQRQQAGEPQFVIFAGQAFFKILKCRILPAPPDHFPRHGHLDAQETVPFSIFPTAGFEKTRQPRDLGRLRLCKHIGKKEIHFACKDKHDFTDESCIVHKKCLTFAEVTHACKGLFHPTTSRCRIFSIPESSFCCPHSLP